MYIGRHDMFLRPKPHSERPCACVCPDHSESHRMKSAAGVALPQMGQANLALTSMHYMVGAFKLFSYWVKIPKDEVNRSPDR